VVAPNYLRFDFTHYQPMTEDELKEVERLVNEQVLRNVKVDTDIMPVEEAIRSGAMALFGEKYSGMMRVPDSARFFERTLRRHTRARDRGHRCLQNHERRVNRVGRATHSRESQASTRTNVFREDEQVIEEAAATLRTSRAD
jgi:alanyl-tRNA synthetase